VIWGRPAAADIRGLVRLLELELDRPVHDALVDLGDLEVVAADAFTALASYTVRHAEGLARIVRHTAIVRPPGLNGAIVSGFFDVSARPFPVSFWSGAEEALVHLSRRDAKECATALEAARERVTGEPGLAASARPHRDRDDEGVTRGRRAFARRV